MSATKNNIMKKFIVKKMKENNYAPEVNSEGGN